jgi:hydrogenase expression/formation protein HypD
MRFVDEFRDPSAVRSLVEDIGRVRLSRPVTFMEVCGSHTMAISRFGLRSLLPGNVTLVSGPGCPVCVTPTSYLDRAVALAGLRDVTVCTFGDLLRVPGSESSLERERAKGGDIRVVYSPLDALALARRHTERRIVFLGVGFETTAPAVAAVLLEAEAEHIANFHVLCGHKLMPPPMRMLAASTESHIRGFLCPGHVSVVVGTDAFGFLSRDHGTSCVIAGFEPVDVLRALLMLVRQAAEGRAEVENAYERAVTTGGNRPAQEMMKQAFIPADAEWRGLGSLPASGLRIAPSLVGHDAGTIEVEVAQSRDDPSCRCPDVLLGRVPPTDCPLFAVACTPARPRGACMVSSEGTCAAYYRFERLGVERGTLL